jgi:hypothetical protein
LLIPAKFKLTFSVEKLLQCREYILPGFGWRGGPRERYVSRAVGDVSVLDPRNLGECGRRCYIEAA